MSVDQGQVLRLAEKGLAECRACHRVVELTNMVATWWRRTLLNATCFECLVGNRSVVIRRVDGGIEVTLRASRESLVVPASAASLPTTPVSTTVDASRKDRT
jgi:hypothetical protein